MLYRAPNERSMIATLRGLIGDGLEREPVNIPPVRLSDVQQNASAYEDIKRTANGAADASRVTVVLGNPPNEIRKDICCFTITPMQSESGAVTPFPRELLGRVVVQLSVTSQDKICVHQWPVLWTLFAGEIFTAAPVRWHVSAAPVGTLFVMAPADEVRAALRICDAVDVAEAVDLAEGA